MSNRHFFYYNIDFCIKKDVILNQCKIKTDNILIKYEKEKKLVF